MNLILDPVKNPRVSTSRLGLPSDPKGLVLVVRAPSQEGAFGEEATVHVRTIPSTVIAKLVGLMTAVGLYVGLSLADPGFLRSSYALPASGPGGLAIVLAGFGS